MLRDTVAFGGEVGERQQVSKPQARFSGLQVASFNSWHRTGANVPFFTTVLSVTPPSIPLLDIVQSPGKIARGWLKL